jgi:hypothetical protein
MKNILAENMLRFRSKNIAAQEAAGIRKLIERQTLGNKTYDSILVTNAAELTDNKVATQIETDADVVFLGSVEPLKPVTTYYGFSAVDTDVYILPISSTEMMVMGEIGKFKTDKMGEPGEIDDIKYRAFYVIHGGKNLQIWKQFEQPAGYQGLIKTLAADYQKRTSEGRDDFWNKYADGLFSLYTKSGIVIGKPEFYKNGKSAAIS